MIIIFGSKIHSFLCYLYAGIISLKFGLTVFTKNRLFFPSLQNIFVKYPKLRVIPLTLSFSRLFALSLGSYEERQLKARIIQQAKNELDEYIIKEEQAVHAQKEREMLREEDDLAKEIKLLMDEEKRIEAGDEYERDRREHAREDALGKYKVYNQFLEPTLSAVKRGMSAKTRVALPERKVDEETREYESNERRMAAQRSGLREEALRVQERQDQALAQQKEQRFKEDMRKIRESKREREVNQPSPQPQQQQQQQQQRIINRNWQQQQQQQTVNTNQQNQQRTNTPKKQNTGSQQKQQPRRKKGLSAKEERLKKIEVLRQRQSELRKARLEEGRLARSKTLLTKKQIKARRRDRELSAIVSRKMRDEKLKQMERAALLDSAERIGRQSARDVQSRERLAEEERRREAAEQRVIGALLRNVPKEEVEREEREEAERNKKLQQQYLAEKELQRQDQAPAEEQESDLFAFLKQARDGANKAAADGKAPAALSAPQPSKALADADVLEVNTEEHVQKRREKRVVSLEQGAKRRHSAPAQQASVPRIVQEDVPLSPESLKRLRSPK